MRIKQSVFVFAVVCALFCSIALAQTKSTPTTRATASDAVAAKIEPLRVLSGVMTGNRIAVERSDWINPGNPLFDYRLASARIVDGKLEFAGSLRSTKTKTVTTATARLITTASRSANPWPSAASATARERKPNVKGERAAGEINEQTQSLYTPMEAGSGCELVYLKMKAPNQKTPVQVGVVLAAQDNEAGNQINQALCRVVRALNAKENTEEPLATLNHLLGRK